MTAPVAAFVSTVVSCRVPPDGTVDVGGVSATRTTIGCGTTIVTVPVFDSLVAVITALPGLIAVTIPVLDTLATVGTEDEYVTSRGCGTPEPSSALAVNCVVVPIASVVCAADRDTLTTGPSTVIAATPTEFLYLAEIPAVPGPITVTRPDSETRATRESADVQVTAAPEIGVPVDPSLTSADSCWVAPALSVVDPGVTTTTGMLSVGARTLAVVLSLQAPSAKTAQQSAAAEIANGRLPRECRWKVCICPGRRWWLDTSR